MMVSVLCSQVMPRWIGSSVGHTLPAATRFFAAAAACAAPTHHKDPRLSHLSQDALVHHLLKEGLLTERAARAMRAVDRCYYVQTYSGVPGSIAYQDTPVPIACGQHMDSPGTVARFLSLLEPYIQPGAKVLDLGAGTGYVTACLAHLAAPKGVVMSIEKQAKLVARARANIKASNRELLEGRNVDMRVCNVMDDPQELKGSERFSAIHVGASVVPHRFVALLKPGGRLVLPVGAMHGAAPQMLVAIDKGADGCVAQTEHGAISTRIAPLTAVHDDEIMT